MTINELKELKELYLEEYRRRIRLNELFRNPAIVEFLRLTDNQNMLEENKHKFDLEASKIFYELLHNRKIIELSGSSDIYFPYQEYSNNKERKVSFRNLENYDTSFGIIRIDEEIDEFEKEHSVLDIDNLLFIKDGPRAAQSTFFIESFEKGPEQAKTIILDMYGKKRS